MHLMDLPPDILREIKSLVWPESQLCLVSRSFRHAFEPFLWRNLLWLSNSRKHLGEREFTRLYSPHMILSSLVPRPDTSLLSTHDTSYLSESMLTRFRDPHGLLEALTSRPELSDHIKSLRIEEPVPDIGDTWLWLDLTPRSLKKRYSQYVDKRGSRSNFKFFLSLVQLCRPSVLQLACHDRHNTEFRELLIQLMKQPNQVGITEFSLYVPGRLEDDLHKLGDLQLDQFYPRIAKLSLDSFRIDQLYSSTTTSLCFNGVVRSIHMPSLVEADLLLYIDDLTEGFDMSKMMPGLLVAQETLKRLNIRLGYSYSPWDGQAFDHSILPKIFSTGHPVSLTAFEKLAFVALPLAALQLPLTASIPPSVTQLNIFFEDRHSYVGASLEEAFQIMSSFAVARPWCIVELMLCRYDKDKPGAENYRGECEHISYALSRQLDDLDIYIFHS